MLMNVFLLKNCTKKQCPVLVEKGLLHSFLFSLFYGTILEKEDCMLMKPDIEKLLNEDVFDDEFVEEGFFLF